jgi:uncharacterized delta-60 repeat protein
MRLLRRRIKGVGIVGAALAACLAMAAQSPGAARSVASSRAGELDATFGQAGRVSAIMPGPEGKALPYGPGGRPDSTTAVSPGGGIAAAHGRTVVELNPDGTPDPHFGRDGRVQLALADGLRFQLASIAFDHRGRLLVAGTTSQSQTMPGPQGYPGPPRAWAAVWRFLPNGQPDRSFGAAGSLETDFGLAAPTSRPISGSSPFPNGVFHYEAASVLVTGIAVDAEDRPLITGAVVTDVADCYSGLKNLTDGYIARLFPEGAVDPSFGTSGTLLDSTAAQAQEPMIDRFGRPLYVGKIADLCGHGGLEETEVVALAANGQPDQSFGSAGRVQIATFWPESSAVDRQGRILLLAHTSYVGLHSIHIRVLRLNSRGIADPTFGHGGLAGINLPLGMGISALGVDERGRPLLAGVAGQGSARPSRFLVMRMTKNGTVDRHFGRGGSVVTGFRRKAGAQADQVLPAGREHFLVSGVFKNPRYFFPTGVALARYSAGR